MSIYNISLTKKIEFVCANYNPNANINEEEFIKYLKFKADKLFESFPDKIEYEIDLNKIDLTKNAESDLPQIDIVKMENVLSYNQNHINVVLCAYQDLQYKLLAGIQKENPKPQEKLKRPEPVQLSFNFGESIDV